MSMRYPGGLIATSPVNARYPSGVWTQAQAAPYQAQNVWTRDQFWPYTTLLLQGDGATNGAQNNTFLDSSSNNFTITRNGNTTQGSFTPYEANGYWSLYQAAVPSDYINFTTSPGALFEFTGDYTIETWVFPVTLNSDTSLWVTSNSGVTLYHAFNIDATNYNIYLNSGTPTSSFAHGIVVNQWNHVALVRSGSTVTAYTNGVSRGTITNSSTNGFSSPGIARTGGGAAGSSRYLSNLRVVKGTAVYTTNFTPPAVPLTAITNTSLLTCQSNRFIDNSANALVATVTGSPSVQAFQPFPGATTWSASVLGGSGYFDGNGDYLTAAQNAAFSLGTGAFTVEAWVYLTANNTYNRIIGLGIGASGSVPHYTAWALQLINLNPSWYRFDGTETAYTSSSTASLNTWNHVVAVRDGSNNFAMFLNGVRVFNQTVSLSYNAVNSDDLYVGRTTAGGGTPSTTAGYISDTRVVKGSAVYDPTQSTLTVPTAPLTAITNTSLLLSTTNAGIYDNSMMNNLETVGNAQVSTSVVKYGTGSMAFDGNGDYLLPPSSPNLAFGTGDCTIEFWYYANSSQGTRTILVGNNLGFTTNAWNIQINNTSPSITNKLQLWAYNLNSSAVAIQGNTTLVANNWYHVALVRNGSTFTFYLNGVSEGTTTSSASLDGGGSNTVSIARDGTDYFNGYIDDLRITKGVARYLTSFTPPPARLPAQ